MAHKFRGEVEIESGLGLPELTTVERTAYTPPADGYVVFDTDLKKICAWDDTNSIWIIGATEADVADKIDIVDGVGTNSLTIQNVLSENSVKFEIVEGVALASNGVDYIAEKVLSNRPANITISGADNRSVISNTTARNYALCLTSSDTHKSSGKWYWEMKNLNTSVNSATSSGRAAGVSDIATVANNYPGELIGQFATFNYGQSWHNGVGTYTGIGTWNNAGDIMRNSLDLDTGVFQQAINGGPWFTIGGAMDLSKTYAPMASVISLYNLEVALRGFEQTYAPPAGFSTFDGTAFDDVGTPGRVTQNMYDNNTVTAAIESTPTSLELGFEGGASLQLQSDHTLTNLPIRGVDGTDSASLITKAYADSFVVDGEYVDTFLVADWAAGSPNTLTVTQATHGISHTSGGSLNVRVQELIGSVYQNVDVETEINTTTGDVTLKTVGATFDGRVTIT